MTHLIDKSALVAEIKRRIKEIDEIGTYLSPKGTLTNLLCYINTLEVRDPYEQCIQYPSIEIGIKAHAEDYSWNIESELFQQLTPEQQKLWRKEIEQACISGGYSGLNLAKDPRYKENLEVEEVDLEKEIDKFYGMYRKNGKTYSTEDNEECLDWKVDCNPNFVKAFAKYFFELGLKAQKVENI